MGILFLIYFANAILLILHEIDSAYWKEWKLFGLKGGMNGFLVFNLIAVIPLLYGLVEVSHETWTGFVISLLVALVGLFTFGIHMYYLKKGRKEFDVLSSKLILLSILIVSAAQVWFSIQNLI